MKVKHPQSSPGTERSRHSLKQHKNSVNVQAKGFKVDLTSDPINRARFSSAGPAKRGDALQQPNAGIESKTQTSSSVNPSALSGFSERNVDLCTGKTFMQLMQKNFDNERPYCFASAILSDTALKSRVFLDGRSIASGLDRTPLNRPLRILMKDKVMHLSEVQFFCARKNKSIEVIGSLDVLQAHPYFIHLQQLFVQEESDVNDFEYHDEKAEVDLNISLLFGAGIEVNPDPEYADFLRHRIDPKLLSTALAPEFSGIATVRTDTRLAEHLLAIGADPKIVDPDDDCSAVDVARKQENHLLLELFRSRGMI